MARLTWSGPALRDLEAITALIAHDSPAYARKFGRRLRDAPKQLTRFPQRGAMVPEFGRPNLREILVGVYRIVYLVHAAQDFTEIWSPEFGHHGTTLWKPCQLLRRIAETATKLPRIGRRVMRDERSDCLQIP